MSVERWSPDKVLSLAPDQGAAKSGRGLITAAHWAGQGRFDDMLWGLCRGSGARPYQVCVDLTGPAYRCSCPSRKIPCKHAVGLMLRWANGGVPDGDAPPDWATEWQAERAARAQRAARSPRAAGEGLADPEAAARRAQQRAGRVETGLVELDRWLADQVEQGLAATEQAGYRPFQTMAARLVDAQAPGIAGAVRRLGWVVGVGANWADRLLSEFALLRLLIVAHGRLPELPPGLAATVRTRIGYPVATDDVLAEPEVRDRWEVLGRFDTADDRLTSRRTWLRGEQTGRFALVLAFAPVGQTLPADLEPGTVVDAGHCFYPAAFPRRALVKARYGSPEPACAAPSGAVPVRAAVAEHARTVAAEPWRESTPMLLADVTPTDDGRLVDPAGDALPLHPDDDRPFWLLAAAGARPVVVAGEYGHNGFRPLAAWPDGRHVPALPGEPRVAPGGPPELPPDLLSAALVGTARRPWSADRLDIGDGHRLSIAVPGNLHRAAPVVESDHSGQWVGSGGSARALLEAVAVALTYRRAGETPLAGRATIAPAPDEVRPLVPPPAAERLDILLTEGATGWGGPAQRAVLGQWLVEAGKRQLLVPPETLPTLLDLGRRDTAVRPALGVVAGRRGQWLAQRQSEWRYFRDVGGEADTADPQDWLTGTPGERLAYLVALRAADPARALDLLAETFDGESPHDRVLLLGALETGLDARDEALIEHALDDRRREIRQVAAELLRKLPHSALGERMAARAAASVHFADGALAVAPPASIDAAMLRDDVDPSPPRGVGLGAWLLEEVVSATPLSFWTTLTGRDPAGVVALPVADGWQPVLLRGLARATAAQRDSVWAAVLLDLADATPAEANGDGLGDRLTWPLLEVLPGAERGRRVAAALRRETGAGIRLLHFCADDWSDELASAALRAMAVLAPDNAWQLSELCRLAMPAMPTSFVGRVESLIRSLEGLPEGRRSARYLAQLAAVLGFRHDMIEEFP
ncbi:SWIM zinc finger family protein [Asanoa iriomotensis]|uniref:SWIM zinc finger family protein n=1 Tax=Asanoa iriomotensis TaxID=234613 RepID=UPI001942F2C2|nr:SWIM zinc finger family protein [Asanoa iriomotensis]